MGGAGRQCKGPINFRKAGCESNRLEWASARDRNRSDGCRQEIRGHGIWRRQIRSRPGALWQNRRADDPTARANRRKRQPSGQDYRRTGRSRRSARAVLDEGGQIHERMEVRGNGLDRPCSGPAHPDPACHHSRRRRLHCGCEGRPHGHWRHYDSDGGNAGGHHNGGPHGSWGLCGPHHRAADFHGRLDGQSLRGSGGRDPRGGNRTLSIPGPHGHAWWYDRKCRKLDRGRLGHHQGPGRRSLESRLASR